MEILYFLVIGLIAGWLAGWNHHERSWFWHPWQYHHRGDWLGLGRFSISSYRSIGSWTYWVNYHSIRWGSRSVSNYWCSEESMIHGSSRIGELIRQTKMAVAVGAVYGQSANLVHTVHGLTHQRSQILELNK